MEQETDNGASDKESACLPRSFAILAALYLFERSDIFSEIVLCK